MELQAKGGRDGACFAAGDPAGEVRAPRHSWLIVAALMLVSHTGIKALPDQSNEDVELKGTELSNVKHWTPANPPNCCVFIPFSARHFSSLRHGRRRPAPVSGYRRRILQSLRPHLLLRGRLRRELHAGGGGGGTREGGALGKKLFFTPERPRSDGERADMKEFSLRG